MTPDSINCKEALQSIKVLNWEETLRLIELINNPYHPPEISKLDEEIEMATSAMTPYFSKHSISKIVCLIIERDNLYVKWVKSVIEQDESANYGIALVG